MCGEIGSPVTKHLIAYGTTEQFEPFTPWMDATGIDSVRSVIKLKAADSTFRGRLAMQTASVRTDNPGSWAAVDTTYVTDDGERCSGDQSVSSSTATAMWVRFGVSYSLSSGTFGQADVQLQVSYDRHGKQIGSKTIQVWAEDTDDYYQPVTEWIPAIEATKVKATLIATGVTSNIQYKIAYQTATTSIESTSAWSVSYVSNPQTWPMSGSGEWNTGELEFSGGIASNMWVRFGVMYELASGTTLGQSTLTTNVGVRT